MQYRELVEKIKSGETAAFSDLIEAHKKLVFHIVFRMIANVAEREDVCQDVFVKVYQSLPGFNFESKLSTWIARIAVNTCLNVLRKKKVPLFGDLSPDRVTIENAPAEDVRTDARAEHGDLSARLKVEIDSLPPQYRTILTLYHLDEMNYAEIGEALNLPDGTVKNYLFRARKLLRQRLIDKYEVEELWHAGT